MRLLGRRGSGALGARRPFQGRRRAERSVAARRDQELLGLADHPAALREGRVRWRLRHRARDVPDRRAGRPAQDPRHRDASRLRPAVTRRVALLAAAVLAAGWSTNAHANDSTAAFAAGGLALTETDAIALVDEDLIVARDGVRVRYTFENRSAADIETLT
ncbi:MAG: DUF4424 domain-containing protein, partial [Alphaproteobacteria bacterium]|nr:DUF4424 domain-containing protein [Alphaproteobacteria bacterium]